MVFPLDGYDQIESIVHAVSYQEIVSCLLDEVTQDYEAAYLVHAHVSAPGEEPALDARKKGVLL